MAYKKIEVNLRNSIYERDDYTCQLCGERIVLTRDIKTEDDYKKEASLDHIIPKTSGGEDTYENLRTICRSCNSRKKDKTDDDAKFLDLNNGGFTRVHNAILLALARTKLNSQESRILFAIIVKTYGFQKSEDWISNSQLEEITGIHRCHCSNIVSRLKKRSIVTKTGNKIKINKYFFNWCLLPKQVTNKVMLPKQVKNVTKTGNKVLPKLVTTKETIQKKDTKEILSAKADDTTYQDSKTIIEYWSDKWKKVYNQPPVVDYAKYIPLAKKRIKQVGLEKIKAICDVYFATDDKFFRDKGWNFMQMLSSETFNSLLTKI